MKTGICTTDFEKKGRPYGTAEKLFAEIKNLGFETTQFSFSSVTESAFDPTGQLEIPPVILPSTINSVMEASEKYSVPVGAINGTYNMAHPEEYIRSEGLRRIKLLIEAAHEMGVPYITLCSGSRCRKHLWTYSDENDSDDAWNDMRESVFAALEHAEKYGITLAIESEVSNIIDTPENARRIMDEAGSDKLKMILDCANLFHPGRAHPAYVEETLKHAMEIYGNDVVIAHGKDIREGDGINFCGTGRGIVDFRLAADLLRESGFEGDMFLHGIYDISDMIRAKFHWYGCQM